jgi:diguanylate cyclase (GGDEF)-like protein
MLDVGDTAARTDDGGLLADRYADDIAALHAVSTLPPGDPEDRMQQWLEAGNQALSARQGIVLLTGDDHQLWVRATVGGQVGGVVPGDEVVDPRIEDVLSRRATVASLGGPATATEEAELGVGALVASPLWVSGKVAGAVAFVATANHEPFTAWQLAVIDLVADGVARVLEHQADVRARVQVESQAEAMIDLIPDPVVRVRRDGQRLADGDDEPLGAFDPCEAVRDQEGDLDDQTLERVREAVAESLDTGALVTAVFATGMDLRARRVEARFVPAEINTVLCIVRDITDRHRAEVALAEQVAFEALVASISTRLISCSPAQLDDAIVDGLGEIATFFAADSAFIDELSPDGQTLRISHLWSRPGCPPSRRRGQQVDVEGFGWLTARFERAGHVFERGPGRVPREATEHAFVDEDDVGVLWVRLGYGGELVGVVGLTWRSHQPPGSDEVLGLVRFAADGFLGAMRRRSIAMLAEGQAEVFELIARGAPVSTALLRAGDLLARNTLGAQVLVVTVTDEGLQLVTERADDARAPWFTELPIDLSNPYGQAVITGEPVVVADARSDPRFGGDAVPDPAFRSVSVLPVRSSRDGRTLAVVAMLGEETGAMVTRAPVRDSVLSLLTVALEREGDERRLAHQATHDPLTGVGNRAALLDRLHLVLARARRTEKTVAVLFCDLDGFKAVNDLYGHDRGDRLLVEVAGRIRRAVRPSDTVCRTGGDEFVVVCEDLGGPEHAETIAERVRESIETVPVDVGEARLDVTASVGVAVADPVLDDPDRLLRNADLAMYEIKDRSRAARQGAAPRVAVAPAMEPFGRDLVAALAVDALDLHQQPLVGRDGSLAGVEMLLRWNHPEHGPLGPERIVTAATDHGQALELGRWVRRHALQLRAGWELQRPSAGRPPVHVNVAGAELVAPGFVESVVSELREAGAEVEDLVIEVREADLRDHATRTALAALDRLSIPVVVDGVGEGGLPLSELATLPVRGIKLAPALVGRLDADGAEVEVARSLVMLAHGLGWRSLAVGVETDHQRAVLFGFGVHAVQGRAVTMPVSAEGFSTWLHAQAEDL